jgi:phthiocerol/phenolphthiocerol synthesis type-I polyketide synthase E
MAIPPPHFAVAPANRDAQALSGMLALSSCDAPSMRAKCQSWVADLLSDPGAPLADVLHDTKRTDTHRRVVFARDRVEAARRLQWPGSQGVRDAELCDEAPRVVMVFPGLGDQSLGMAATLHRHCAPFRARLRTAAVAFNEATGQDLEALLTRPRARSDADAAAPPLSRTTVPDELHADGIAHAALFCFEYALARAWIDLVGEPAAVLGYSLGEYVAACIAGVLSMQEALACIGARAGLLRDAPAGRLLAVGLGAESLAPLLEPTLAIAAVNSPVMTVVGGSPDDILALSRTLAALGVANMPVHANHAFHTPAMADVAVQLRSAVPLGRRPEVPWLSTLTGTWMPRDEAVEADHWARHCKEPVLFAQAASSLDDLGPHVTLEVGPGNGLTALLRQLPSSAGRASRRVDALTSTGAAHSRASGHQHVLITLSTLWCLGIDVDWHAWCAHSSALEAAEWAAERHDGRS